MGTTLSSLKAKKVETPIGKRTKFVYVPKVPQLKINIPTNGEEILKTTGEVSILSKTKSSPHFDNNTTLDSPSVLAKMFSESPPKRTSCTLEEFFYDIDDGTIDNT